MRLPEEAIQDRRNQIILTAFRLFSERGIETVPLKTVAKAAGVGESTIYRYFADKTTLVLEAFTHLWGDIMTQLETSVEASESYSTDTGYQQVATWLEGFRQLYKNHANFILFSYEAKLYLLRHNIQLDHTHQDALMRAIRTPCLDALERGKADGSISANIPTEDMFFAIWGSVRGYIVKIVIYDRLYGADSPWEPRYDVLIRGILCAERTGWWDSPVG